MTEFESEIITPKFYREKFAEGSQLFQEKGFKTLLGIDALIGLGLGIALKSSDAHSAQILFGTTALFFIGGTFGATISEFSGSFHRALIEFPYPEIDQKSLSFEQVKKIMLDPVNAVIAGVDRENGSHRHFLRSIIGYKKRLLTTWAKAIKNKPQDLEAMFLSIPHPQLKLHAAKLLRRYTHQPISQWENALKPRAFLATAETISRQIKVAATIEPFVRLAVYRCLKEAMAVNQLPTIDNQELVENIKAKVQLDLEIAGRLTNESAYDPESATVGFEIEPEVVPPMFLFADLKEIDSIIKHAKLGKQIISYPFEIVVPPTRTPVMQLLILREIMMLTGIPAKHLGIHINFGGLGRGEEGQEVLALQRLILAGGRIRRDNPESFMRQGRTWDKRTYGKGEVGSRRQGNPLTGDAFRQVTPEDENHPEFKLVSELRASVGGEDFFTFARGFIAAHQLANLAKAKERQRAGEKLSPTELKKASRWDKLIKNFNRLLVNRRFSAKIDQAWSDKEWRGFARLITDQTHKRNRVFQENARKTLAEG